MSLNVQQNFIEACSNVVFYLWYYLTFLNFEHFFIIVINRHCSCDVRGTEPGTVCDKLTGQCVCKKNVMGLKCDLCKDGYYGLDTSLTVGCLSCNCDPAGTKNGTWPQSSVWNKR
jgi:hypothetical protein